LDDAGNWSDGIPTALDTAIIPDAATTDNDPNSGTCVAGTVTLAAAGVIAGGIWSGVVTGGAGSEITGGTFAAAVTVPTISGGTFNGAVTVTAAISDGTFNSTVDANGYDISGGTFGPASNVDVIYADISDGSFLGILNGMYASTSTGLAPASAVRVGTTNAGIAGTYNPPQGGMSTIFIPIPSRAEAKR